MSNQVQKAAVEVKRLWSLQCEFDNIPYDSKFAVFSTGNPFTRLYSLAVKRLMKARLEVARRNAVPADVIIPAKAVHQ